MASIHDSLKTLSNGDKVRFTVEPANDSGITTITGIVTHSWHSRDTGYADGEIDVDIEVSWDDVKHIVDIECLSIRARTNYSGTWKDPVLSGTTFITSDEDESFIEETDYVKLGTISEVTYIEKDA